MDPRNAWPFFLVWVALAIGSAVFFMRRGNVELKRRLYPAITIGAAVLIAAFSLLTMKDTIAPLIMIPFLALIVTLNLRNVRFCGACGRTVRSSAFHRPKFCDACGSPLDESR